MKIILLFISVFLVGFTLFCEPVMLEGVKPGISTMDYNAAVEYAKTNKLPIIIDFTGSDWCGWCKLMQTNVFTKKEWTDWSISNIVMITIDSPNDESIVPKKYKDRNEQLKNDFNITGFPTYVILDSDGVTELGRLGAGQTKTPKSFIDEIKNLLRMSTSSMIKFSAKLQGKEKSDFENIYKQIIETRKYIAEWKKLKPEEKLNKLDKEIYNIQLNYSLTVMNAEDKKTYNEVKSSKDKITNEMNVWLNSNPANNKENQEKYRGYLSKIESYNNIIDLLISKYSN